MKQLKCYQSSGATIQEVLDEFWGRAEEFGISERDVVSVSAWPVPAGQKRQVHGVDNPWLDVAIVFWCEE